MRVDAQTIREINFNSIKVQLERFNAEEAKKNRDISIP